MLSRFARVLLAFCFTVTSSGQNNVPAQTLYGLIAGTIVDRPSNKPIRHAIVTLSLLGKNPQDAVAWSDDAGNFAFGYLPEGHYRIRVEKDGYQNGGFGRESSTRPGSTIVLKPGENRSGLVIPLQHLSAISGTVTDESGDPIANAQIFCLNPQFRRGVRHFQGWQNAITDSQGHFKLGVQSGKYALLVQAQNQGATTMSSVVSARQVLKPISYLPQYYPGAESESGAALISVPSGREITGMDFHLVAKPAVQVSGRVLLPPEATAATNVMMMIFRADAATARFGVNRMGVGVKLPDHTFQSPNISPGSYFLLAQAEVNNKHFRGLERIEVGEQGLSDVQVSVQPGVTVSGTVSYTGRDAEKQPTPRVTLFPGDGAQWNMMSPAATVNKDGTFKINDVPPGVWDINVNPLPDDGYVKSMLLGDQDVLSEKMEITPGTVAPLKIVLGTKGGQLEGDIVNSAGEPAEGVVLLEPQGALRKVVPDYPRVMSDEKGHFEFKGQTPGSYKLYALEDWDFASDPDSLSKFKQAGVPVQLKEAQKVTQKLQLIPAKVEASQ